MDYFASLELELRGAMRRSPRRRWSQAIGSRGRRIGLAIVLSALTAGTALAATGVIPLGAPVHVPAHLSPLAGSGLPAPGGSRILPLTAPDPEGGPAWGLRVVRTTRGLLCLQVARVQDGRLGELGIDGAFAGDGRFHPLPARALPAPGSELGQGFRETDENAICHLPSEAFIGFRLGVERSAAGPADTTHLPRRQLRDLYFGLLGAAAVSVAYAAPGSSPQTQPVVPGLGAYLFVTATGPRDPLATGGGAVGSAGGLAPIAPLSAISYRLRGAICERSLPAVHAAHPCPPPQSLYGPSQRPGPPLHRHIESSLRVSRGVVTAALITFRAPFAVTGAAERYELRVPTGLCHGPLGGYAAQDTDRDIAPGTAVTQAIRYPFVNGCGRRTARIEVLFESAGRPPRAIGSVLLREPAGTGPGPPH